MDCYKSGCMHAELSALKKAAGDVKSIFVARIKANGDFAMAKPCPVCRRVLDYYNIENVYYTGRDGDTHYMKI